MHKDALIDQTVGHVYWKDREGKYLNCNREFCKVLGLSSPEEVIGKTDRDLLLSRLGEEKLALIISLDQRVIQQGKAEIVEEIGADSNNNPVHYLTHKAPLRDAQNNIIGLVGTSIVNSIFDIKNSIIQQTVGNFYWKDRQGRYLGCNHTFASMIGLSSPDEILGKTDRDLFLHSLGEEKLACILELDQRVMEQDKVEIVEEIGVDAKKEMAYYLTHKAPLKDKQGVVIGLVGTSIDITKEKQAQLVKQQFLENMSHDMRTPLAGIYGLAKFLNDHYAENTLSSVDVAEMLSHIANASGVLLEFLDQILSVFMLGKNAVKIEPISVKVIIDELTRLLSAKIHQKRLTLQVNCPNVMIQTDQMRLFRILLNLFSNAVKFTDMGDIQINVHATQRELRIEIQDTGIGIPEDQLESIFEPFHKLIPSNHSAEFHSCGLGLYLARHMAEEMGAKVTVESQLNQGSKFTLFLSSEIEYL